MTEAYDSINKKYVYLLDGVRVASLEKEFTDCFVKKDGDERCIIEVKVFGEVVKFWTSPNTFDIDLGDKVLDKLVKMLYGLRQ